MNKTVKYFLVWLFILTKPVFAETDRHVENTNQKIKYAEFVIRMGQGGFYDNRSPVGKLGGGQLALDINPVDTKLALSFSSEYYTNSPAPSHAYEIKEMLLFNMLYTSRLKRYEKARYFIGGGAGTLVVPKENNKSEVNANGIAYDLEAGVNVIVYKKLGVYGVAKYLYAQKREQDKKTIDFNEFIILLDEAAIAAD